MAAASGAALIVLGGGVGLALLSKAYQNAKAKDETVLADHADKAAAATALKPYYPAPYTPKRSIFNRTPAPYYPQAQPYYQQPQYPGAPVSYPYVPPYNQPYQYGAPTNYASPFAPIQTPYQGGLPQQPCNEFGNCQKIGLQYPGQPINYNPTGFSPLMVLR